MDNESTFGLLPVLEGYVTKADFIAVTAANGGTVQQHCSGGDEFTIVKADMTGANTGEMTPRTWMFLNAGGTVIEDTENGVNSCDIAKNKIVKAPLSAVRFVVNSWVGLPVVHKGKLLHEVVQNMLIETIQKQQEGIL